MSARNRWARLGLGLRAGLAVLLCVGAAVLAVDLSDWRYVRFDLTAAESNTLDPAVADVLDKLPEPVVVDVFLRSLDYPYDAVFQQAKARLLGWLALLQQARRAQFEVRLHDPKDFETIKERQRALGTEGSNKLVVSCGERRDELELFGELCTIDWGNPSDERLLRYLLQQGIAGVVERGWKPGLPFRAAELRAFHGEELLTEALLKVSSGRAPKIYFGKGHGEPALDGGAPGDFSRLKGALERDGFELAEWDPLRAPGVPADCDVLALIGAHQPYQERTRAAIRSYAEAGGRVLAAPDLSELNEGRAGGIVDLLKESPFGIVTRPGIVCQPFVDYTGQRVDGSEDCAWLLIDERGLQPTHPLTEPLRQRGRRVKFTFSASFESAGLQADSALALPLISSPSDAWRDLAPYDFRHDPAKGEKRERHTLVTAKELRALKAEDGSVKRGRLVAVASAFFFDNESIDVNRDFVLNACNWLAEREFLLRVSPQKKSESFLDFQRSRARPILTYSLLLGLPGVCAAIGLAIFLRRRS
ncbi:MAG: GldG family protein [Planctomycetes bacterium]|nr:GldG family protein [Planctomycetota bacterium]